MRGLIRRVVKDEKASSALEYGVIGVIIALGIVGALASLQGNLQMSYANSSARVRPLN